MGDFVIRGFTPVQSAAIRIVSYFETHGRYGSFDIVTRRDGTKTGNFGLISFTDDSFQRLMSRIDHRHPGLINEIFHSDAEWVRGVIPSATNPRGAALATFWETASRTPGIANAFNELGTRSAVQRLQLEEIRHNFLGAAEGRAHRFHVDTPRGLTFTLDIVVHSGGWLRTAETVAAYNQLVSQHQGDPSQIAVRDILVVLRDSVVHQMYGSSESKQRTDFVERINTIINGQGTVHQESISANMDLTLAVFRAYQENAGYVRDSFRVLDDWDAADEASAHAARQDTANYSGSDGRSYQVGPDGREVSPAAAQGGSTPGSGTSGTTVSRGLDASTDIDATAPAPSIRADASADRFNPNQLTSTNFTPPPNATGPFGPQARSIDGHVLAGPTDHADVPRSTSSTTNAEQTPVPASFNSGLSSVPPTPSQGQAGIEPSHTAEPNRSNYADLASPITHDSGIHEHRESRSDESDPDAAAPMAQIHRNADLGNNGELHKDYSDLNKTPVAQHFDQSDADSGTGVSGGQPPHSNTNDDVDLDASH